MRGHDITAALATVAATDMVTTISDAFARRFAEVFDLSVRPPPFPNTDMTMTLVWSHVRATDPIHARPDVLSVQAGVFKWKRHWKCIFATFDESTAQGF